MATHLLHLVDKKGQHHENGKHRAEMLLAQSVIMLQVVSLVFQGVEGFVFDLPPGTAGSHDLPGVFRGDGQIGDPTEPGHPIIFVDLPVFKEVDQEILAGPIERRLVDKAEKMQLVRIVGIHLLQLGDLAMGNGFIHPRKQKLVIPRFDAKDKTEVQPLQILDMGRIAAQRILGDDQLEVRVLTPQRLEETTGRVPLAIVFLRTVLAGNHFREEGDHLATIRMHQGRSIHLLVIQCHAVATRFLQAVGRGHLG